MSKKFNLNKIVGDVQKFYNKTPNKLSQIGVGDSLKSMTDGEFLTMPKWYQEATNTKGLPFGALVMIAGDSDSGKTSCAIAAMKAAQEQGVAILYVETEGKTTTQDLVNWGVDPTQIMLVKSSIAEEAFDMLFKLWDGFSNEYPKEKILVIFDSIGNVVSKHDMDMDMTTTNQKPGGKGKTNRMGINSLIARSRKGTTATLIVNYTYDNMGSPGKTNAGGKALNLFSSLTYQTSRKGWLEKTVKGNKIRIGAKVQWRLFKNHVDKSNPGPKVVELDITKDGIVLAGASDNE
jgi:RecA/RadA recombinase